MTIHIFTYMQLRELMQGPKLKTRLKIKILTDKIKSLSKECESNICYIKKLEKKNKIMEDDHKKFKENIDEQIDTKIKRETLLLKK